MRWVLCAVALAACGGTQVPTHNGYKSDKAKPWKKAKDLKFDDKQEAKVEGDLSYPEMRRAAWFAANLSSNSQLDLRVEITPPGEATNEDFDLGVEVYDPHLRVISRSDLEEGGDAHELNKTKSLVDLVPGRYLIHLYLQGRLDTADYVLHAAYKTTPAAAAKSDYPAQVPFPEPLAMVPITDDTPKNYKPQVVVVTHPGKHPVKATPKAEPPPPPPQQKLARITGIQVTGAGVQITLGIGTAKGGAPGMKGTVRGVGKSFTISSCTGTTCTAVVAASQAEMASASVVELAP